MLEQSIKNMDVFVRGAGWCPEEITLKRVLLTPGCESGVPQSKSRAVVRRVSDKQYMGGYKPIP